MEKIDDRLIKSQRIITYQFNMEECGGQLDSFEMYGKLRLFGIKYMYCYPKMMQEINFREC